MSIYQKITLINIDQKTTSQLKKLLLSLTKIILEKCYKIEKLMKYSIGYDLNFFKKN